MNDRVNTLIEAYELEPHPEGGAFKRAFSSQERYEGAGGQRSLAGSIFFLLGVGDISHFHQIDCEELWFFHEGCGMKIYIIEPDGSSRVELLGNDVSCGQKPMVVVGKGAIFAAENIDPEGYTFISCVTAPQFWFGGFRLVPASELPGTQFPQRLFL